MSIKRRLSKLEGQASTGDSGGYLAVAYLDEEGNLPETVEAFLPGGYDRQEMAPDDERIETLITFAHAGTAADAPL